MNFSTLEQFLQEQLLNECGDFNVDSLPIRVHAWLENEAREYANIDRMVSTADIMKTWGSSESFGEWRIEKVKHANAVNHAYVVGKIDGLVAFWTNNQVQQNSIDPDELERINSSQYAQEILDRAFEVE